VIAAKKQVINRTAGRPGADHTAGRSDTKQAARRPGADHSAGRSDTKQAAGRPGADHSAGRSDTKQAARRPGADHSAGRSDTKLAAGRPGADQIVGRPDADQARRKKKKAAAAKEPPKEAPKNRAKQSFTKFDLKDYLSKRKIVTNDFDMDIVMHQVRRLKREEEDLEEGEEDSRTSASTVRSGGAADRRSHQEPPSPGKRAAAIPGRRFKDIVKLAVKKGRFPCKFANLTHTVLRIRRLRKKCIINRFYCIIGKKLLNIHVNYG
jgi:hypothetical protein